MPRAASTAFLFTLFAAAALGGCDATPPVPSGDSGKPSAPATDTFTAETAVKDLLLEQASAWNHGDLPGFCGAYAEDALFLSPSGVTKGRGQILARYQKRYGSAPETMGSLNLQVLEVRGRGRAASVAMKWSLSWDPKMKKPDAKGLSLVSMHQVQQSDGTWAWRIQQDASM